MKRDKLSQHWRYDLPQISTSSANEPFNPLLSSFDKIIRAGTSKSLGCSLDNFNKQLQEFKTLSPILIKSDAETLVSKMEEYSKYILDLQQSDAEIDQAAKAHLEDRKAREKLFQKKEDLFKKTTSIRNQIYELENSLFYKYHEQTKPKGDDPCRDFLF